VLANVLTAVFLVVVSVVPGAVVLVGSLALERLVLDSHMDVHR